MELLAFLVVLLVGVILGYWLQNPALAHRERAVRQKLDRAEEMLADAIVETHIAEGQLRLVQAVRRQVDDMLDFASRAPELGQQAVGRQSSPIFDSMHNWLKPTGAMPVLPEPQPGQVLVTVDVGGERRGELVAS